MALDWNLLLDVPFDRNKAKSVGREALERESASRIRHGGIFRDVLVDAIKCIVAGATPSSVKLAGKHSTSEIIASNLCQVARFLVRSSWRHLSLRPAE